jgi:hypothetical protein
MLFDYVASNLAQKQQVDFRLAQAGGNGRCFELNSKEFCPYFSGHDMICTALK